MKEFKEWLWVIAILILFLILLSGCGYRSSVIDIRDEPLVIDCSPRNLDCLTQKIEAFRAAEAIRIDYVQRQIYYQQHLVKFQNQIQRQRERVGR